MFRKIYRKLVNNDSTANRSIPTGGNKKQKVAGRKKKKTPNKKSQPEVAPLPPSKDIVYSDEESQAETQSSQARSTQAPQRLGASQRIVRRARSGRRSVRRVPSLHRVRTGKNVNVRGAENPHDEPPPVPYAFPYQPISKPASQQPSQSGYPFIPNRVSSHFLNNPVVESTTPSPTLHVYKRRSGARGDEDDQPYKNPSESTSSLTLSIDCESIDKAVLVEPLLVKKIRDIDVGIEQLEYRDMSKTRPRPAIRDVNQISSSDISTATRESFSSSSVQPGNLSLPPTPPPESSLAAIVIDESRGHTQFVPESLLFERQSIASVGGPPSTSPLSESLSHACPLIFEPDSLPQRPTWCQHCMIKEFRDKFSSWTSGNEFMDAFIRRTQMRAKNSHAYAEWIPFEEFEDVKFIGLGGFGTVYEAVWKTGPKWTWVVENIEVDGRAMMRARWKRMGPRKVILKHLNCSRDIGQKSLNELFMYFRSLAPHPQLLHCFGVTRPLTSTDYMFVLDYADIGNLRQCLSKSHAQLAWPDRLLMLIEIATALEAMHSCGIVHRDLHSGNILLMDSNGSVRVCVSDIGLCMLIKNTKKCGEKQDEEDGNEDSDVIGVMPYLAPDILCGGSCDAAADMYSYGVVMWEFATGELPFADIPHDIMLAKRITEGLRPEIDDHVPACYAELMAECWNDDPEKRPTAKKIIEILKSWRAIILEGDNTNVKSMKRIKLRETILSQFMKADLQRIELLENAEEDKKDFIHPDAIYVSRKFEFHKSPEFFM
ncbi:6249_t:CDS:2 [Paraglomus occultum]|uniref:6249_t:CDS:1 n=1 Tax=Paraglomus occultum TaxID=144539 RepID=A0A9N8ZC98_9GLOM|nr:6249_t:CDS:2 [Paraglomus occultum]